MQKNVDRISLLFYGNSIMNKEVEELATKDEKMSQMRVDPKLVEEAKVAYVKTFNEDYKNINNLGNGILRWFIDSHKKVADGAKKQKSA